MPTKTAQVWAQLGGPADFEAQRFDDLAQLDAGGWTVTKGEPLFPRPA
jgi:hypothetical protein